MNDATIVVPPSAIAATAITRISMEHADVIGPTIEDIARNKSGAIRAGRPVVVAEQKDAGVVAEVSFWGGWFASNSTVTCVFDMALGTVASSSSFASITIIIIIVEMIVT